LFLPTSRRETSIRVPAKKSWRFLPNLHREGNTIILVTHENDIAQHAHRIIYIRDGKIASDEAVKKMIPG